MDEGEGSKVFPESVQRSDLSLVFYVSNPAAMTNFSSQRFENILLAIAISYFVSAFSRK